MNREQKRLLQRQGQIAADGTPLAAPRQPATRPSVNRPIERRSFFSWLREVRAELRKVSWPTRLEVRNYSAVVLLTLVVVTGLIFALDYAFSEGAQFLFR